ncbi:MAG: hypothetical protein IJW82_01990 [Clostridia bacterium]|nr:hypothetical protein [Clostridia bacterium]
MKKILIITVTAGEGHNSISKALVNKLSQNPLNKVKLVDLYKDFGSEFEVKMINDGYLLACKLVPNIYNLIYRQLQKIKPKNRDISIVQSSVKKETPKILNCIYSFKPDVIIMPHFYPAIIVTNLKKYYPIEAKTISILTDYCVHPFWESAIGVDYMITPSEDYHKLLLTKGYNENQLLSFGLPVKEEFSETMSKQDARKELNLDNDLTTILIMQGGGGMGGMKKILKQLLKCKKPLQILCVNGKDEKSKLEVEKLISQNQSNHKIINYGFINFVATAMSASDLIIGKCGCISVNEALNKEKPLLICTKLVEQEKSNMLYLTKNNASIYVKKPSHLVKELNNLSENKKLLDDMVSNIQKIRKPNALSDLCDFVESFDNIDYKDIKILDNNELKLVNENIKNAKRELKKSKKVN